MDSITVQEKLWSSNEFPCLQFHIQVHLQLVVIIVKYLHSYFICKIFTDISTDQKYNVSVTGGQKCIFSRSNTKLGATKAGKISFYLSHLLQFIH